MDLFGEPAAPVQMAPIVDVTDQHDSSFDDGLQTPRTACVCLGHENAERHLLDMLNNGRLPHALIFSGPRGVGKATMAYRLAKCLLAHPEAPYQSLNTTPDHPAVRRVVSGAHPDLLTIERAYDATKNTYKSSVSVSDIRKVPSFLRMTASSGGWRVVIVDDADTMNRNAQNAILKMLEEPPAQTSIILVTHRLGALIPTIRSRAQVLSFSKLAETHVRTLLSQVSDLEPDDLALTIRIAEGRVGQGINFVEQGGIDVLKKIIEVLNTHPDFDFPSIHRWSEELGRKGQDRTYALFVEIMLWLFSEFVRAKAHGRAESMISTFNHYELEHLIEICDNLQKHFTKVERGNLDKRLAVLQAFMLMA